MQAPLRGSDETFEIEALDVRADGLRRTVSLSRNLVVIARRRKGVFMRIALAPRAFLGVLLRLAGYADGVFRYEVKLAHRDPEFGVTLFEGEDRGEADAAWKSWACFVGAPALVEREEGQYDEVAIPGRPCARGLARRRAQGVGARRPRFLTRRKVGRPLAKPGEGAELELFGAGRDGS